MPKVSVIMPSYNHEKYLPDAIESVLNQSYEDIELIITDDCSKDNSRELIRKYGKSDKRVLSVYHEKNAGEGKSRNDAIALSSGEYIAFCDADDVWEKEKLKHQLSCFDRYPEHKIMHSDTIIIDGEGKHTGRRFSDDYQKGMKLSGNLFEPLCITNFINISTVILHRECLDYAGLFEEDLTYVTDWIYLLKVAKKYTFFFIDEPLVRYRVHSDSSGLKSSEYALLRIKGFNFILDSVSGIGKKMKSKIFYSIAMEYRWLKDKETARKYFFEAIKANPLDLHSYFRLLFY